MSFGSVMGAIISLRNNKRESKRKHGNLPGKPLENDNTGIKSHRTPSREELRQIKQKLQAEHKKRQLKVILISAAFLIFFCFGFYFLMF